MLSVKSFLVPIVFSQTSTLHVINHFYITHTHTHTQFFSLALILDIDLVPVPQGLTTNATMIPIATAADVSKTDAFIKHDRNLTFFEHSINFMIPYSVRPGNYQVVFSDKATNTKLSIPIEIRPAASSTSSSIPTATSIPGRPQSSGSIFSQGSAGTLQISKALMGLVGVAGFVVFLLYN